MLENDIKKLHRLLQIHLEVGQEEELRKQVENFVKFNKFEHLVYVGMEINEVFPVKKTWDRLNSWEDNRVIRPIIIVEFKDNIYSIGFNPAQRSVSFSKNGSKVKFFNFKKTSTSPIYLALPVLERIFE